MGVQGGARAEGRSGGAHPPASSERDHADGRRLRAETLRSHPRVRAARRPAPLPREIQTGLFPMQHSYQWQIEGGGEGIRAMAAMRSMGLATCPHPTPPVGQIILHGLVQSIIRNGPMERFSARRMASKDNELITASNFARKFLPHRL